MGKDIEYMREKFRRRQILMTIQWPEGTITHVKNNSEGWSPIRIGLAIKDTENNWHEYYFEDHKFGEIVFTVDVVDGKKMLVPEKPKLTKKFIYQIPFQIYEEDEKFY